MARRLLVIEEGELSPRDYARIQAMKALNIEPTGWLIREHCCRCDHQEEWLYRLELNPDDVVLCSECGKRAQLTAFAVWPAEDE